ncbi:MAG: hypothetical protein DI601_02045 [Azospirillum brasilense]|nr:MAG: hypothetical protein DI601_02045 [Azospirillum brasilense]
MPRAGHRDGAPALACISGPHLRPASRAGWISFWRRPRVTVKVPHACRAARARPPAASPIARRACFLGSRLAAARQNLSPERPHVRRHRRRSRLRPSGARRRAFRRRIGGSRKDLVPLALLRPSLAERFLQQYPGLTEESLISRGEVARLRAARVEEMLEQERGELGALEHKVAQSLASSSTLSTNTDDDYDERRSLGERLADVMASFGGSWSFLLSFAVVLLAWMAYNLWRGEGSFDPYPFILLNLVLSCLAAIQAPVIMMSQRRQEAKDRARALNDYAVNLKVELEVRNLHEKLDHLLMRQWERLAEIQQLQLEIMQERRPRG